EPSLPSKSRSTIEARRPWTDADNSWLQTGAFARRAGDQRAQVAVVVRSIAQERLERGERTVEQVDEVEREARLVAGEVVAGVVEPRRRLAVGGRVRLEFVGWHPRVARRVDEEDREPRTLRRVHLGQPPTVAPRQGGGDGHAARGRVADEVELEQHVGAGAPVGRVE